MTALATIPQVDSALVAPAAIARPTAYDFSRLPKKQPGRVDELLAAAKRVQTLNAGGVSLNRAYALTKPEGLSVKRWEAIFLKYRRTQNWRAFVDHRFLAETWAGEDHKLPEAFVRFWIQIYLAHQRDLTGKGSRLVLLDHWRAGRPLPGYAERPAAQRGCGHPDGWSYSNLMRQIPDKITRKAARQGAVEASLDRAPARLTRAHGWAMGRIYVDDFWHDAWTVYRGILVRPLMVWAVDYYTGKVPIYYCRPRLPKKDGHCEGLKKYETVCLIELLGRTIGYSEHGTVFVCERGTSTLDAETAQALSTASDGLITVELGGINKKRAHDGQWGPRGGGNPRSKSPIESLGNLLHNACSAWPGQMGLSPERAPEDIDHMLKYARRMIEAGERHRIAISDGTHSTGSGPSADQIQLPVMQWAEFGDRLADVMGRRLNGRTGHELEGWDAHIIPDEITGKPRRRSPDEVWTLEMQRQRLRRFNDDASAIVLGPRWGNDRTVRKGELVIPMREHSTDDLLFDAGAVGLKNGDEVRVTINVLLPDRAFCFAKKDHRFLGAAPRIVRADAFDADARNREFGRVSHREAQTLAPVRALMAPAAAERRQLIQHNERAIAIARGQLPAPQDPGAPTQKRISMAALAGVGAGVVAPPPVSEHATGGPVAAGPPVQAPRRFRLGAF